MLIENGQVIRVVWEDSGEDFGVVIFDDRMEAEWDEKEKFPVVDVSNESWVPVLWFSGMFITYEHIPSLPELTFIEGSNGIKQIQLF